MLSYSKSKKIITIFILILSLSVGYYLNAQASENIEEGNSIPQVMEVSAQIVESQPTQIWKEFSARLQAVDYAEIKPQVSGTITEIKFKDGQNVEKGDTLYVIDPRPYKAAVNQLQAEANAAKNQADLAKKEFQRAEGLIQTNAISQRILDERKSASKVAKANINSAYARLEQAKINLNYAYVKAPISGRVSRAEIKVGNLVEAGPNAPLLTSIVSTSGIYADFEVDEQTYLNQIRSNTADNSAEKKIPVKLFLANSDQAYEGFIDSFDNQIDPTSATIRARAYFNNENGYFLPGMFATIKMGSAEKTDAIMIDEKAIGTDQDRKFVYTVNDDNSLAYRQVSIGDNIGGKRVIISGLSDGDTVVTDGLVRLRPEMVVKPKLSSENDAVETVQPVSQAQ